MSRVVPRLGIVICLCDLNKIFLWPLFPLSPNEMRYYVHTGRISGEGFLGQYRLYLDLLFITWLGLFSSIDPRRL